MVFTGLLFFFQSNKVELKDEYGVWHWPINPKLRRQKQEEFEDVLCYIVRQKAECGGLFSQPKFS